MTRNEIQGIVKNLMIENVPPYDPPTEIDWKNLEGKFMCRFNEEFKSFMELMAYYSFPGDILNVSTGQTDGNDTISFTYDCEMEIGGWNSEMIPFYSIGNGDYFCLSKRNLPNSPIYYYDHEKRQTDYYTDLFSSWINELPNFLK